MMTAISHLPCTPCSLRLASTWSPRNEKTTKNSCDPSRCGAAVPLGGGEALICRNDTTCVVRKSWSSKKPPRSQRLPASWICTAGFEFRTGSSEQAKEDDDADAGSSCTLTEMAAALEDDLFRLNEAVNKAYKGRIGADVRDRVQVLYQRAAELKRGVGAVGVTAGGRVPVHLTATLKALQREHASVENIVRLAMEAGPLIIDIDSDSPSKRNSLQKVAAVVESTMAVASDEALNSVFNEEKEGRNASLFQSLIRESTLETVAQFTTSGMASAPAAAQESALLSAFRREIECRVMEQLGENNKPTTDFGGACQEQEQGLGKGQIQIQNLPVRGMLPRRRDKGALEDDEDEEEEAEPHNMLQGTLDQSSLADSQQQSTSSIETTIISKELKELRNALSVLEPQLRIAKEGSTRKTQLQQLAEEMSATVPLDIHSQLVKLERESLVAARTKLAQVTAELKEKEGIISAIKQERMAEQESLIDKVKELSTELSKRISAEEVEAAINKAVRELETELRRALKRAESTRQELKTKEGLLKQLQTEWAAERASLRGKIADVQEQVTEMRAEQEGVRTDFMEAVEKMTELEVAVAKLQQSTAEAGEGSSHSLEKAGLATTRSVVTGMAKSKRAQTNSIDTADSRLAEPAAAAFHEESSSNPQSGELGGSDRRRRSSSAGELLEAMLSDEKAEALEAFFAMMGVLAERASGEMGTREERSGDVDDGHKTEDQKVEENLGDVGSNTVDAEIVTKPIITLYYESTWEYAYLHYSVDNLGWTEPPGVCMRNDIVVNNVPLKVINVEGSSIEFVLTDGKGSWDCAPLGGNYHIQNGGTFLLSSGCIEQK